MGGVGPCLPWLFIYPISARQLTNGRPMSTMAVYDIVTAAIVDRSQDAENANKPARFHPVDTAGIARTRLATRSKSEVSIS